MSTKNNKITAYHVITFIVLVLLFGLSLLNGSFRVFVTISMVVIFGCAMLLNSIQV